MGIPSSIVRVYVILQMWTLHFRFGDSMSAPSRLTGSTTYVHQLCTCKRPHIRNIAVPCKLKNVGLRLFTPVIRTMNGIDWGASQDVILLSHTLLHPKVYPPLMSKSISLFSIQHTRPPRSIDIASSPYVIRLVFGQECNWVRLTSPSHVLQKTTTTWRWRHWCAVFIMIDYAKRCLLSRMRMAYYEQSTERSDSTRRVTKCHITQLRSPFRERVSILWNEINWYDLYGVYNYIRSELRW